MRNELLAEKALLTEELEKVRTNLAEHNSVIESLQAENTALSEEWKNTKKQLDKTRKEIEDIRSSFGYRVMRYYASRIDGLCPDGTRRGKVRKRIVDGLRARSG